MRSTCWLERVLVAILVISLSSCQESSQTSAQGYIEGRYTYMATPVSGVLKELLVERGTMVKQGQKLFMLEEEPELDTYRAAVQNLQESIAARDAIIANLTYAKLTYERYKVLVPKKAIQQSALDNAESTLNATNAQLAQSKATIAASLANLAQAKWTKEQKVVVAPVNARVFDTYYRLGEFTIANKAVLSLLAPEDIKAIFYVPQPILGSLRLRQSVEVQCDGCVHPLSAKISFISPVAEFTPPVIYSIETNDKLIFRVEAVFKPEDAINMHPGQPVSVTFGSAG